MKITIEDDGKTGADVREAHLPPGLDNEIEASAASFVRVAAEAMSSYVITKDGVIVDEMHNVDLDTVITRHDDWGGYDVSLKVRFRDGTTASVQFDPERLAHQRWQQERHAAALAQLKPVDVPPYYTKSSGMFIAVNPPNMPTEAVEPWHGKASGCA